MSFYSKWESVLDERKSALCAGCRERGRKDSLALSEAHWLGFHATLLDSLGNSHSASLSPAFLAYKKSLIIILKKNERN